MIKYYNFIRKKTTSIYLLVFLLLFNLLVIILGLKYNTLRKYDDSYKNTILILYTDKEIDNYLYKQPNIINTSITKEIIDYNSFNYKYSYKLKHYYNYTDKMFPLIKELSINNIQFQEDIENYTPNNMDIGSYLDTSNIFIWCILIILIMLLIIIIVNIIIDEKESNIILYYLGFKKKHIYIINFNKIVFVILIPLIISLLTYHLVIIIGK